MSAFVLSINIILYQFIIVNLSKIKHSLNLYYNNNEIILVIKGKGNQNILNDQFDYNPSFIFIN